MAVIYNNINIKELKSNTWKTVIIKNPPVKKKIRNKAVLKSTKIYTINSNDIINQRWKDE